MHVIRQVEGEWFADCFMPKFKKEGSIMIWGGVQDACEKKSMVVWN